MQDFKFVQQDLKRTFFIILFIAVVFAVLYYLESSRSLLTGMLP